MAGYLGTKAVLLSTTAADVVGNAEIGGRLTVDNGVSSSIRIAGNGNNAVNTEYATLEFYNNDPSTAGPNVAASIKAISTQSTGSGAHMILGTTTGSEAEGTSAIERMRIDSSGNVGIGTSSPSAPLDIAGTSGTESFRIGSTAGGTDLGITVTENDGVLLNAAEGATGRNMKFATGGTERMRIDSSGNVLVGTTAFSNITGGSGGGIALQGGGTGTVWAARTNDVTGVFNRLSSDGGIVEFRKDGSTVGSISGNAGGIGIGTLDTCLYFYAAGDAIVPTGNGNNSLSGRDNIIDLGNTSTRFDDIYATNGTIQTSDRNEKQDIEALSDAEQRVAVACKGLLRKFRWKDAVAEKGDDARIHFGIIAQDLQDAFAAEGLDAGRYAMFISSTWWETQTEVPAVEAVEAVDAVYEDVVIPAVEEVLDEEGNVVTEAQPERIEQRLVTEAVEAVEAKEAYTRTDTYETLEEAPEGATERTRLGVRYPELLAFIIAAI